MADDDSKDPSTWMHTALGVLALVLFAAPGMLLLSIIKTFWLHNLDTGQMWTFALLFDVFAFMFVWALVFVLLAALRAGVAKIGDGIAGYGCLSVIICSISLVCAFGFHVRFFRRAMYWYFGWPDEQ